MNVCSISIIFRCMHQQQQGCCCCCLSKDSTGRRRRRLRREQQLRLDWRCEFESVVVMLQETRAHSRQKNSPHTHTQVVLKAKLNTKIPARFVGKTAAAAVVVALTSAAANVVILLRKIKGGAKAETKQKRANISSLKQQVKLFKLYSHTHTAHVFASTLPQTCKLDSHTR